MSLVSNVQQNRMSAVVIQSIPVNIGNNDGVYLLRYASNRIKTSKKFAFIVLNDSHIFHVK